MYIQEPAVLLAKHQNGQLQYLTMEIRPTGLAQLSCFPLLGSESRCSQGEFHIMMECTANSRVVIELNQVPALPTLGQMILLSLKQRPLIL